MPEKPQTMKALGTTYWGKLFLHQILQHTHFQCSLNRVLKGKRLSEYPGLREACEDMYSGHIRSPLLLGLLIDMYQEIGDHTHLNKALEASST